ncbi:MAG: hypothetical protein H0X24_00945 [Ktedonobacterales bacterium]|nr:hypothetical protein [Ktedonobacterales bacterium]
MAQLVHLLDDLETRDLPMNDLIEFMLRPCDASEEPWLLASDQLETWEACLALVARNASVIPVERVATALTAAYAQSAADSCEDTDAAPVLEALITLAGTAGPRFSVALLIALARDERILVRRKVAEALGMIGATIPLVGMLEDVSAQIRLVALQQLRLLKQLSPEQAQRLAHDANARVREAALAFLDR